MVPGLAAVVVVVTEAIVAMGVSVTVMCTGARSAMVGGRKSGVVIVGAVVAVVRSAVAVAGLVVVEWPAGRGSPCCAGGRFWWRPRGGAIGGGARVASVGVPASGGAAPVVGGG